MWAILPLKDFVSAKQRLSGLLSPSERRGLFQAMVEDVLATLCGHPQLDGVLLVSDDPAAKLLAQHYGAEFLPETELEAKGLNAVVTATVRRLAERGNDEVLVVHGDLPLLTREEISTLIATHRRAGRPAVTIATDRHRKGSNCVVATPASALEFCYGADSLAAHSAQSETLGAQLTVLELTGAGCDIDRPADLLVCLQQSEGGAGHTREYLRQSGIDRRLALMTADEANGASAGSIDRFTG